MQAFAREPTSSLDACHLLAFPVQMAVQNILARVQAEVSLGMYLLVRAVPVEFGGGEWCAHPAEADGKLNRIGS